MPERWILNASPLIVLARIDRADLLAALAERVVVLLAKQRGLVPSAVEILRTLRNSGFRLDDDTIREALKRTVNEEW